MKARFFRSSSRILACMYLSFKGTSLKAEQVKNLKTRMISDVESLLENLQEIQKHFFSNLEPPLFEYFDSILTLLENILVELSSPKELRGDKIILFLTYLDDCEQRTLRLKKISSSSKKTSAADLFHYRKGIYRKSCFYCSAPIFSSWNSKVTIPGMSPTIKVSACPICRFSLEKNKKTHILFFSEKGKQLHWSHDKSYIPSAEYWQMNQ